jgi:hypothetical protein
MKLSSRKQLLKEAEEELGKIKDEATLNESETNFLVDRLRADTGNYKKFDKRYTDMINADAKKISVPITAKVPVSLYYDIEHEEVRYDISEDTGTNYPILEKEVMKNPQFKTEMKRYSDMAKTFMKDCQTWIRDTAKKHNISISRPDAERIMWNLF